MIAWKRIAQNNWQSQPQQTGGCGCGGGNRTTTTISFPERTFRNKSNRKVYVSTPLRTFAIESGTVAINVPDYAVSAFEANENLELFTTAFTPNENIFGYTL